MKSAITSLVLLISAWASTAHAQITVFAASSTTEVLKELGRSYTIIHGEQIQFNFASSGTLARQIEAGAPADLFISANERWMDYLAARSLIQTPTRFDLAVNSLVLIAPSDSTMLFDGTIERRLAVGELKSVPAGIYAKEALDYMGWFESLKPKLIQGSNVRTVLMYVERGEVDAGIVYVSDALASDKVLIVGTFPKESHTPIVYSAAACSNSKSTDHFINFLKSTEAKAVFKQYGFK
jgi:molybdate transport system substrate-binding protein